MAGFGSITLKLKEMYQMITLGGDAELELVDSLDPFSEGIVFSVRPPKKSWKNISNLSGVSADYRLYLGDGPQAVKRRSPRWPWSSRCITTSPRLCTSWTRSTRRWWDGLLP